MRSNYLKVYIHLVWATWDRQPLIDEGRKSIIFHAIENEAREWKVVLHALGAVDDHVHVLVELPSTISLAHLMNQIKGKSSILCGKAFRWQGSYSAISVSKSHVPRVINYIEHQAEHHKCGDLIKSLEITPEGHEGVLSVLLSR